MKTINRKKNKEEPKKIHVQKAAPRKESTAQNTTSDDPLFEEVYPVDSKEIEFLKVACPETQKEEIIAAMKATFYLRRKEKDKIFELFPRFMDIPFLVRINFLSKLFLIDNKATRTKIFESWGQTICLWGR